MSSLRLVLASLTVLPVVTLFLFHGASWAQETTTLATSAADATIDQANPNTNFGAGVSLGTSGGAGIVQRSVVRFDLSTLASAGVAVKAATLTMTLTDPPIASRTIEVHNLTSPFTEGTATYNSPWTAAGGDFGSTLVTHASGTTRGGTVGWTDSGGVLAAAVQGWFASNTGFLLKDATEGTNSPPGITVAQAVGNRSNFPASSVTSPTINAEDGDFYIAAISSDGGRSVQSVTGVPGLTWVGVAGQLSDDNNNRISLFQATGTATANGTVTADFGGAQSSQSIGVARYTGVNPDSPFGAQGANNSGGVVTNTPHTTFTTSTDNSLVIGAIAEVLASATPDPGFSEDVDTNVGAAEGVELTHSSSAVSPRKLSRFRPL